MFGYINVNREKLSKEDICIYQAYYCGLCKRLKANCGRKGKMLINYDMTFLVILLSSLYMPVDVEQCALCGMRPTKKRKMLTNNVSDYVAQMNIMLSYHNLVDDWKDDRNPVKYTMASFLRKEYEDIVEKYPRQAEAVNLYTKQLAEYEKNQICNLDLVAGITGEMLGEIFAWKKDQWYEELKTLGFYMGKFIFLMDAYEDYDEDIKKRNYNPLRELVTENESDFDSLCRLMMDSQISECGKAIERLPIQVNETIIRNVLDSGVWVQYDKIKGRKNKKSVKTK